MIGTGLGALTINSYLCLNPQIAEKIAGVILSAPFFGLYQNQSYLEKLFISLTARLSDDMCIIASIPWHRLSRNKQYLRQRIAQTKNIPLMTASLMASLNRNMSRAQNFARKVTYPYLVLLGEKDTIVSNRAITQWHNKTQSQVKEIKVISGAFHELLKEPNNDVVYE